MLIYILVGIAVLLLGVSIGRLSVVKGNPQDLSEALFDAQREANYVTKELGACSKLATGAPGWQIDLDVGMPIARQVREVRRQLDALRQFNDQRCIEITTEIQQREVEIQALKGVIAQKDEQAKARELREQSLGANINKLTDLFNRASRERDQALEQNRLAGDREQKLGVLLDEMTKDRNRLYIERNGAQTVTFKAPKTGRPRGSMRRVKKTKKITFTAASRRMK